MAGFRQSCVRTATDRSRPVAYAALQKDWCGETSLDP
jgi:hypothetical protein